MTEGSGLVCFCLMGVFIWFIFGCFEVFFLFSPILFISYLFLFFLCMEEESKTKYLNTDYLNPFGKAGQ